MAASIKLDADLYERIRRATEKIGYASPEELVTHAVEKELSLLESTEDDADVTERLRGLGYIE